MKKEDLLAKIQALPDGVDILIMDVKKNMMGADADGMSSAGLYEDFNIHMMDEELTERLKRFAYIEVPNLEDEDEVNAGPCHCKTEDKHGETSVMCCNHCGAPTEKWWLPENTPSKYEGPYTAQEKKIADGLALVHNRYVSMTLDKVNPDINDWVSAIHRCQDILNHCVLARAFPNQFNNY